jgi:hypothetical protein
MKSAACVRRVATVVLLFVLIFSGFYLSFVPTVANAEGGGADPIFGDSTVSSAPATDSMSGPSILWSVFTIIQLLP